MNEIDEKIERAWELRVNRNIEKCLSLCTELKQKVLLPPGNFDIGQLDNAAKVSGLSWSVVADVALLWASVVRTLHGLNEGTRLVAEVEQFIWKNDPIGIFALYFEKGMLAFSHGDYALALEYFLVANTKASKPWEKLCSRANTLFCFENLGLSQESTFFDVSALLTSLDDSPAKHLVVGQIEAYSMRLNFRDGKIKEVFCHSKSNEIGQSQYYLFWTKSLPYHKAYQPLSNEDLSLLHEQKFFLNKGYRIRSLKGILHPDDLATVRPTEFADRLYLWVWKWLLSPESFSIQKVTAQLKNLNLSQDSHRMTVEDAYLIRNSFLWLALFDPGSEKLLLQNVSELEASLQSSYPIFEIESLFIHYCRALRDEKEEIAKDLLSQLEQHPLCKRKELYFCPMVQALRNKKVRLAPHLIPFCQHLRTALFSKEPRKHSVTVDLIHQRISVLGVKKNIHSRPMVAALELMQSQETVSIEQFCNICFGISKFDSIVHMPRVYNLLARLKNLKHSKVSFRVRDGFVISEGDWKSIHFVRGNAFSKELLSLPAWTDFIASEPKPDIEETINAKKQETISWPGLVSRSEIEKLLRRPRSSTNRILSNLIKEGLVVREGGARRLARYRMKSVSEIHLGDLV